jgi:hypothetical protein
MKALYLWIAGTLLLAVLLVALLVRNGDSRGWLYALVALVACGLIGFILARRP